MSKGKYNYTDPDVTKKVELKLVICWKKQSEEAKTFGSMSNYYGRHLQPDKGLAKLRELFSKKNVENIYWARIYKAPFYGDDNIFEHLKKHKQ